MNDEQTEDEQALPPLVYVPCTSAEPTNGELNLEMRQLADGRLALPVYSALDRLVTYCGERQPWAAVPRDRLVEASMSAPFDVIVLDLDIPNELRVSDTTEGVNYG